MVQITADGALTYDSRLDDYALLGLTVTPAVNKGGAAEIVLPPNHPGYNRFTSYKTLVEIYRDSELLFRGRPLYPEDDFYNRRRIVCEGERCFLRDGVMRPYVYQDGPAEIFDIVIAAYNAQVEEYKQFEVGTITVTDPNNYIRLESEKAEQIADTVDKLVERCGGYIVFTTNAEGKRVINWLAELNYRSNQVIEFGENLLDFARTGANTDLATVIIPYGAKIEETVETVDETTGETITETISRRVTIESVTDDGNDFIQDYDAVALRGVIAKPVYWDDVELPENLLAKAQQYLANSKLMITSLSLSAVDLSVLDKSIDTFQVGDLVRVRSKSHNVDEDFRLMDRTYDLLNPANDRVTLGKDAASLTGADVAGDRDTTNELHQVEHQIIKDYKKNVAASIESLTATLTSLIQQTSTSITSMVAETYMRGEDVEAMVSTQIQQLSDSITLTFTELEAYVDENDASAREQLREIKNYIRFDGGDIILGEEGNQIALRIQNDRISFLDDGGEVAYISEKKLYITDAHFLNSLRVGRFAWLPRENGNLSLVRVGD